MASALSNRQNCTRARKTLHTRRGRMYGAGCVRQWFRTAEPLGERRYANWNTHTHIQEQFDQALLCLGLVRLLKHILKYNKVDPHNCRNWLTCAKIGADMHKSCLTKLFFIYDWHVCRIRILIHLFTSCGNARTG